MATRIFAGCLLMGLTLLDAGLAHAFGGRRRAAGNNDGSQPAVATTTAPVATQGVQQSRTSPTNPRTQGPCYAYPNTDPRRFNFWYNH